jgi:hypothetical protein
MAELVKVVEKKTVKGHMDRSMTTRVLDALVRGQQIELSQGGNEILEKQLQLSWKNLVGKDPPAEITVQELMKQLMGTEEEEEDEEEDEEFVDSSGKDTENAAKGRKEKITTSEAAETTESETDDEEETSDESG